MYYDIPIILKNRLIQYGLKQEQIEKSIKEYEAEAREYISLVLPYVELTTGQLKIFINNFIQYRLFAMLEMEELVKDKKEFLEDLIDTIKQNEMMKKEQKQDELLDNIKNKGLEIF